MRPLTDREKRTLKFGGAALLLYLVLLYGVKGVKALEGKRSEYRSLLSSAVTLREEALLEREKARVLKELRESLRIDLDALKPETAVGEASAAIGKAAQACGIQLGPTKETRGRSSSRELGAIQIDGQAPAAAAVRFLHGIKSLGFPLVVDSLQLNPVAKAPGQVQFTVSVVVLDFAASKAGEGIRA